MVASAHRVGQEIKREDGPSKRAPRDDSNAKVLAGRQHLPLLLSVKGVVVVLHSIEDTVHQL
jgi:hypothetical protein